MAAAHHHHGAHARRAVFHLFFRKAPFSGGYAIAAGVSTALRYLTRVCFDPDDVAWLRTLRGADDRALFTPAFLDLLAVAPSGLGLDVDAVADGTPVFPREPLMRVSGPVWAAQLVETALLNMVNFETLIATKASRVCRAAGGPVLEFGLRRAQGVDGALSASRAAYIGGVASTSNVLAGRRFGLPVRGTHAHAWVMCFPDELAAFQAYAEALPNNVVLLVDTYDTRRGIERAIEVGHQLRARGHRLLGVRLDSGDLAELSRH
ncbi:MAG TPA: nicotinate phosphoribosyltransferase, partial [Myxococcota bacterium]|nr:nicotinate phosphoribosyltransferase [Myxococcota bacterium]